MVRVTAMLRTENGHQLVVALVAGGGVVERLQKPRGRAPRPGCVQLQAEGRQDLAHVALEAEQVGAVDMPRSHLLPRRGLLRVYPRGDPGHQVANLERIPRLLFHLVTPFLYLAAPSDPRASARARRQGRRLGVRYAKD